MLGWYPGHMHKARRQIKDALPEIDVVIEVLDARLPYSSTNPVLSELTRHKPVLKLLSRADLADPARTREWVEYFDALPTLVHWRSPRLRRVTSSRFRACAVRWPDISASIVMRA